jgi:aquaporin Z
LPRLLCCISLPSGSPGFDVHAGFASNGYGVNSPGGYSMAAGFVSEVVLTAFFLIVIMGATDSRAGFAPVAIGLCLTLINLVGIPVTNLSVNPARSTGPALFAGGWSPAGVVDVLGRPLHRRRDQRHDLQALVR